LRRNWYFATNRRRVLEPDLDLVSVRIGREQLRFARDELALLPDGTTGVGHGARGQINVLRILQRIDVSYT
jgi:hypothetical protein